MTSVDSGVETGNDSNDSGQAETQLLFVPPTTNAVKRRLPEIKKIPEDSVTQLESLEKPNEDTAAPKTVVCLAQNSSPLSLSFGPVLSGEALEAALENLKYQKWLYKTKVNMLAAEPLKSCVKYGPGNLVCKSRRSHRTERLEPFHGSMWEKRMRFAAATNNVELVTNLLEKGVSPNNADVQGRSPLHLACSCGYAEIVKLLLDYGADPNMTDTLGNTPLHLAAVTSKTSVVVLLLKAGTNVLSFDRHGYNPLQLAQTKLRLLQNCKGSEVSRIKEEVHKVVEMLLAYLQQQKDVTVQIEALSSFCSRLSLSNTTDQVQVDVKDLLASIDALNLSSN